MKVIEVLEIIIKVIIICLETMAIYSTIVVIVIEILSKIMDKWIELIMIFKISTILLFIDNQEENKFDQTYQKCKYKNQKNKSNTQIMD